eukprot:TRINITY_DN80047_c0_g1_i1.p1 TRINITY_DN80047_c0_g1~~TRINITY_DN80047_c0_g1_i1.p1  ORF type:complete len:369 (-),score=62.78 TRINITY_DN80047_c0_g1_i1:27-1133(-)
MQPLSSLSSYFPTLRSRRTEERSPANSPFSSISIRGEGAIDRKTSPDHVAAAVAVASASSGEIGMSRPSHFRVGSRDSTNSFNKSNDLATSAGPVIRTISRERFSNKDSISSSNINAPPPRATSRVQSIASNNSNEATSSAQQAFLSSWTSADTETRAAGSPSWQFWPSTSGPASGALHLRSNGDTLKVEDPPPLDLPRSVSDPPAGQEEQLRAYVQDLEMKLASKSAMMEELQQVHQSLGARLLKLDEGLRFKDMQIGELARRCQEEQRGSEEWRCRAEDLNEEMSVLRRKLVERENEVNRLQARLESQRKEASKTALVEERKASSVAFANVPAQAITRAGLKGLGRRSHSVEKEKERPPEIIVSTP